VGADSIAATAALLTSELATNAVVHAGSPYTIEAQWQQPLFRVDVLDSMVSTTLRLRASDQPGPGGWGLRLVDRLSHAWGVTECGDHKAVWFDLDSRFP
jgi:anti-sigma regulatory factor (Ser/Thr protein kinase)